MTPERCNVCNGLLRPHLPSVLDPQTYEKFSINVCADCGLGHTTPQPEDLGRYYGQAYHGGRHSFTADFCAARRLRIVSSVAGSGDNKLLLDVGCGDGTFLLAAQRKGWKVFGTEFNPTIARKAGLDVREAIEEVKDVGLFDCITLWHSLEHMRDPKSIIEILSKMLKTGGSIIIAVPDFGGLQAQIFKQHWVHLDVPRHLYHFTNTSLTRLTESVGMRIERKWHQEFEYDLLGWVQSILNTCFPVPNVFLYSLTGQPTKASTKLQTICRLLGMTLSILMIPTVIVGTFWGKGGTVIIAASRIWK
jgi:SAM-dependent methyltransferase